jgi:hypothetical protein
MISWQSSANAPRTPAHCAFFPSGDIAAVANYYGQLAATFRFNASTGKFGSKINDKILSFSGYTPLLGQLGEISNDTIQ